MTNLTRTVVFRVSAKEMKLINKFARTNHIKQSAAVRSLLAEAFNYMKKGEFGGGSSAPPSDR